MCSFRNQVLFRDREIEREEREYIAVSLTADAINSTETNSLTQVRFIQPRALLDKGRTYTGRNINN